MNLDEDPLDLFEDDGDGVIETILLFDEEEKDQKGNSPHHNRGCSIALFLIGSAIAIAGSGLLTIIV